MVGDKEYKREYESGGLKGQCEFKFALAALHNPKLLIECTKVEITKSDDQWIGFTQLSG